MRLSVLFLIVALLLAACGGGGSDTGDTGGSGGSGSFDSFNAEALMDPSLIGEGAYTLSLTGALDYQISNSELTVTSTSLGSFERYIVELGDEGIGYYVRIGYSGAPVNGTYTFAGPLGTERTQEGVFTAAVVYTRSPDPADQYNTSPTGTITFTQDGDYITAVFDFEITSDNNANRLRVQGSFNRANLQTP